MTDTTDLRGGILKNCKEFRSNNKMEIIRVFSRVHSAKQISKLFSTILIRLRIWSQLKLQPIMTSFGRVYNRNKRVFQKKLIQN